MSPSTSTKAIPECIISYVKYQHSKGNVPTHEDIKLHLKATWNLTPYLFGTSNDGLTTSDWDSSVYPTFRSMYSRAKNKNKGNKGLEDLTIKTVDSVDYVFHVDSWLSYSAGASYKEMIGVQEEKIKDIHTTAQFTLCGVASKAGLKVFVPPSDTNKKSDNGMCVAKEYSDILVSSFEGLNDVTREIDVIFCEERLGKLVPIKAFEIENSTAVTKGIARLKALGVPGTIVSTKKAYRKIFDDAIKYSFTECKETLKYAEFVKIKTFSENIIDFEESFNKEEVLNELLKKI